MRGSATEVGRSPALGVVIESLPLPLQLSLLLLGATLSRFLWEVNRVVVSVVAGFTAYGICFYACIVIAGTLTYEWGVWPHRDPQNRQPGRKHDKGGAGPMGHTFLSTIKRTLGCASCRRKILLDQEILSNSEYSFRV